MTHQELLLLIGCNKILTDDDTPENIKELAREEIKRLKELSEAGYLNTEETFGSAGIRISKQIKEKGKDE